MRQAVLDRLHDLIAAAKRLERIIADGEPPGLLLARAAVDIDQAAASLEGHAAKLAGQTSEAWPP